LVAGVELVDHPVLRPETVSVWKVGEGHRKARWPLVPTGDARESYLQKLLVDVREAVDFRPKVHTVTVHPAGAHLGDDGVTRGVDAGEGNGKADGRQRQIGKSLLPRPVGQVYGGVGALVGSAAERAILRRPAGRVVPVVPAAVERAVDFVAA